MSEDERVEVLEHAGRLTLRLLSAQWGGQTAFDEEMRQTLVEFLRPVLDDAALAAAAPRVSALVGTPVGLLAALVDFLETDYGFERRRLIDTLGEMLEMLRGLKRDPS